LSFWHRTAPGTLLLGAVLSVTIEGMKFTPERLEAHVGDTVTWTNKDIVPHTVTAEKGASGRAPFDSGAINQGGTFKLKVRKSGELAYSCVFHPVMKGSISAKPR